MKKILLSLLAIVIIVSSFYFVQHNQTANTSSQIKIGIIAPLSGQYSFVGDNIVAGARLYEKEWNEKHPGSKLTLVVEDDAFDAKKGIAAYKKFTELDKVDAVFNVTSPTVDALYNTVANKNTPFIQLGGQGVAPTKDSIFQVTPAQAPMYTEFGNHVKKNVSTKPVLLTSDIPAYKVFAEAFKKSYGDISEVKLSNDPTSSKTIAAKLASENYTDYIVIASPQEAALILKELLIVKKSQSKFFLDSSFISGFPEFQKILGSQISKLEGSDVLSFKDISPSFMSRYKTFTGKDAGIGSDLGYEAIKLLAETKTDKDWVQAVQNAKVEGVTSEISFNEKGERSPSYQIKKFVNGKVQ